MKNRINHKIIRVAVLAIGFAATFLSSNTLAEEATWGPVRSTYTMQSPAPYATFNSITNNPTLEDERKFIRVAHIPKECDQTKIDYREAIDGTKAPTPVVNDSKCVLDFKQSVEIEPGEQYMVYIYYHNDASSIYNSLEADPEHGIVNYQGRGIARYVKMFSEFPELILGQRAEIKAEIQYTKKHENSANSWSWDTEPTSVWAKAYLTNSDGKQITLKYVAGSGKHYNVGWLSQANNILPFDDNNSNDDDAPMVVATKDVSTSLFTTEGIYLGFNNGIDDAHSFGFGDGYVFGCEPYHGIVTYVLQSAELKGEVDKKVSIDGTNYKESVTVAPNGEVTYLVTVKNTGQKEMTNVVLNDALPTGMTLVAGSVELRKEGSSTWDKQDDSAEYNLHTIGSGQTVYIRYKAKAGANYDCIGDRITNTARITYDGLTSEGLTDEDEAIVVVRKTGEECANVYKATIKKEASVNNGRAYKEAVTILPGETVTFRLTVANAGALPVGHITVKDVLPEGLTFGGTATIVRYNKDGEKVGNEAEVNNLSAIGIEVLNAGESVQIIFKAQAGEDYDCTGKELTNTATITYAKDDKDVTETDTAKVTVKKDGEECVEKNCKTNPEMEECKELPDTGPMEIAIFSIIITGITGGTIYLILAKRKLNKMTASVVSEQSAEPTITDKDDGMGMPNDGRE